MSDKKTTGTSGKDNKDDKKRGGLKRRLINIVNMPLLLMGIVTMIFSYFAGYRTVSREVERGLEDTADVVGYACADIFRSDIYFIDEGGRYRLDTDKTDAEIDEGYIAFLKERSGTDISVLYYDVRLMTTLTDASGEKLNGTVASKKIVDEVFAKEETVFYDNVMIGDKSFYACYVPVSDHEGRPIGMIATCKPSGYVKQEVMLSCLPLILISLIMMALGAAIGAGEAKKLASVIEKEKSFLGQIADGNLRANLDADILKRDDELGEMGKFTVHVQRFIREMIERDTLTKLYTRRIGQTRMMNTYEAYKEDGVLFQIVMGDIDHFKRFNDTYGHDCGDLVLQSVAGIFNRMMMGKGYAVRWGGEEFILVYENLTFEEAYEHLCLIREEVISHVVEYKDELLNITMTFGIVPGSDDTLDDIIKVADELLYIGKEGGRDRIVKLSDYEDIDAVKEDLEKLKNNNNEKDERAEQGKDKRNEAGISGSASSEEDRLDALIKGITQ